MSSILDAQRRNGNDAVALVAPATSKPILSALLASVITMAIAGSGFWWWQKNQQVVVAHQPQQEQPSELPVSQVKQTAPEPVNLDFELGPLPRFDELEKVDLLALRQQQFEDLLAQAPSPAPQTEAPRQPSPVTTPADNNSVTNSPSANKSASQQGNLEQRFAAAVQATETLSWEEQNDVTRYDDAPLIGALDPSIQALVPAITFNSHVFSSDPSRRYVTLNNQEFAEGDFVNANIELVAIRMDDIVLRVAGSLCRLNALSDWG
ncbi:general secretion pathway protein GspB [Agarivorans gilvus]|uniref:Type II secretion system protein GspB C-terminal domain-containing protein n=1 Tax=Agarivorans gilvus TaxID=680279 RepID=A0ABQ1I1M4_9ALTE|nr:general secretion pathway protein GspB [Agarivorans gilvus]GGB05639.1 hypothetical protein GCM10007414_18790 [Agarivorans gilvus]